MTHTHEDLTLTLATAIRLGAAKRPQTTGTLYSEAEDATCVLGAAFEGVFGRLPDEDHGLDLLIERFPVLMVIADCPGAGCLEPTGWLLDCLCTHLNDAHRWTRESIADVVEPIEISRARGGA